ncbi:hypothetical protein PAE1303 [Pyrobaculum aerophilum str. IM2]|uniref:Vitamin K epoxide reductase domain-containing protein n=2 Tax=Pyrobaculum aerophilum TaxID=13773 RepID=Q8ZXF9_PYRAE|nr:MULTISPECIES: vitamin K epoxide reductase family protein [Pyrobaculum]AAL63389.1 hypothetical protein PAE1303 [Pyrobaculum aerophilum str. IM2]HII47674.1 vitamin K epoxide reductase [Pyrobaculum aerophilum]
MALYILTGLLAALGVAVGLLGSRLIALSLLAAAGLLHTLFNKPSAFCAKYKIGGCEAVLSSPYARPFGIPLEYLGAAWFAGVPIAYYLGIGLVWSVMAFAGVIALVAIEAKLRAFCIYCTVAHVIGLAAAFLLL